MNHLLNAKAHPRASRKWNKVVLKFVRSLLKPSLWVKLEWIFKYSSIVVEEGMTRRNNRLGRGSGCLMPIIIQTRVMNLRLWVPGDRQ